MFTPSNDLERCAEVGHIVGSMSGITIAALVSSSLSLYGEVVMGDAVDSQTQHPTGRPPIIACFPPVDLLSSYITGYLTSVHQWYPIIDLNLLGDSLHAMYQSREHMDLFPRFVILMVAALAPPNPDDMNDPADYFRFAITLVPSLLASKTLDGIKVLLLLCIYGMRSWQCSAAQDVNTWELIGMAMRLAVSIGLTRNNEKWSFTLAEVEHRRKVWWSLYSMERYIAIMTGRILSIRNEGIDALMPQTLYETLPDRLLAFLPKSLTAVDYRPFVHLIEQRRLLGDVLETVYITKIVNWARQLLELADPNSVTRDVLQLAFHQMTLFLHRPSPSFPCPPDQVLNVCMGAARASIRIGARAVEHQLVHQVLPGWQGFSIVFSSGITLLYCSWSSPGCANAIQGVDTNLPDPDIELCRATLKSLAVVKPAQRYGMLFERLMNAFNRISRISILDVLQATTAPVDPLYTVAEAIGLDLHQDIQLDQQAVEYINSLLQMDIQSQAPG
ncbi:hypothetical protein L486_08487 [Kwoniella mangroviensis CBS 10435]|uniref:Xylanolytic transcriptional activator regulatory domain-containing protein n=1 Tax=Kwoniella mangroviensis CBS 10435 TaxID=1331196 RepID=A0A1B9IEE9_9TREE|nr:hypothetical protein L486_08487 [Kwoniella mangroviensis CBS 10435]